MTYELAKQLKDAGFPQESDFSFHEFSSGNGPSSVHYSSNDGSGAFLCAAPTLSQLIEACGEWFEDLSFRRQTGDQAWLASWFPGNYAEGEGRITEYGPTPEEAVAHLWLALNKKQ